MFIFVKRSLIVAHIVSVGTIPHAEDELIILLLMNIYKYIMKKEMLNFRIKFKMPHEIFQ